MYARALAGPVLLVLLFELLGHASFATCHQNGGGVISCGVTAFFIGGFKAVLFVLAFLIYALFNGVTHLFAGS